MPGILIGPGAGRRRRQGGTGGGFALASLPVTPTARWHAHFGTNTVAAGRITAATDLRGLANLSEGAAGAGPRELTDGLGRKFWRFEGSQYLNVATALTHTLRDMSVFIVGRQHRANVSPFYSLGSVAAGTVPGTNPLGPVIGTTVATGVQPYQLRGNNVSGFSDTANRARMILGSQLQVIGAASRTTALGGQRLYVDNGIANVAQTGGSSAGIAGAEIGRYSYAPGAAGTWMLADIYEILVYNRGLTNAEADGVAAALVSAWSIPAVTNQLVLEGDSITQGTGTGSTGTALGNQMSMLLSDPGSPNALPAGWRVVNVGVSGGTVASCVTRRDEANAVFANGLLAGRNVVACQIGRNDIPTRTGAQVYADIVALINTASNGYLQRGWEVRQAINIAVSTSLNAANADLRTLLRAGNFLTDTLSGAGQAFDGKVKRIDLPLITSGGSGSIFDTVADAGDSTWFQGDNTHPTAAGAAAMVSGAETPANGYRSGVLT